MASFMTLVLSAIKAGVDWRLERVQRTEKVHMQRTIEQLKQRTEPRRLSKDEAHAYPATLSPFKGTSIEVQAMGGDTESILLADQMADILKQSGWSVVGPVLVFDKRVLGIGIVLQERAKEKEANAIGQVFLRKGWTVVGEMGANIKTDVRLVIGSQ